MGWKRGDKLPGNMGETLILEDGFLTVDLESIPIEKRPFWEKLQRRRYNVQGVRKWTTEGVPG